MTKFTAKHFYFTDHYRKCAACQQATSYLQNVVMNSECRGAKNR